MTFEKPTTHPYPDIILEPEMLKYITLRPKLDLPAEIWMLVLEHVDPPVHFARPSRVKAFLQNADAVAGEDANPQHLDKCEADAARSLPAFERQAWGDSRRYYGINRNTRAAAIQLHLSRRWIQVCKPPAVWDIDQPIEWVGCMQDNSRKVVQLKHRSKPPLDDHKKAAIKDDVRLLMNGIWGFGEPGRRVSLHGTRQIDVLAADPPDQARLDVAVFVRDCVRDDWARIRARNGSVEAWL